MSRQGDLSSAAAPVLVADDRCVRWARGDGVLDLRSSQPRRSAQFGASDTSGRCSDDVLDTPQRVRCLVGGLFGSRGVSSGWRPALLTATSARCSETVGVSCMPGSTDRVVADGNGNALYSTNVSVTHRTTWTLWSGPAGASFSEAFLVVLRGSEQHRRGALQRPRILAHGTARRGHETSLSELARMAMRWAPESDNEARDWLAHPCGERATEAPSR
jgi:hypothetical protein